MQVKLAFLSRIERRRVHGSPHENDNSTKRILAMHSILSPLTIRTRRSLGSAAGVEEVYVVMLQVQNLQKSIR